MKKLILLLAAATTVLASCGGDDGDKYSDPKSYANSLNTRYAGIGSTPAREIFARGDVIFVTISKQFGDERGAVNEIYSAIKNEVNDICTANNNFRYSNPWVIEFQRINKDKIERYVIDCSNNY